MTAFFSFCVSAVMSLWNCVKGLFVKQGNANEAGLAGGSTVDTSSVNWSEMLGLGLGAAMLINPNGTGHLLGKVGSATADAVGDTVGSVVDNVSSVANNLIKQPWFWVAGGVLLLWLLKD